MEPHKELPASIEKYRPSLHDDPKKYFEKSLEFAKAFYSQEMEAIASTKFDQVTPEYFFREYMWVVHATGFSAKAVGKFMPRLAAAYGDFRDLASEPLDVAAKRVCAVCNNPQKIRAIHQMARIMCKEISSQGWSSYKSKSLCTADKLVNLPYIGKVTCFHLARNIGLLDSVKPDLHLIRMAEHWGFKDCVSMCKEMKGSSDIPLGIVDLVLWYAASTFGTLEIKKEGAR